jgi:SH3-like domain-containing protein
MAKIIRTLTVKLRPNTDSEVEEVVLREGDDVKLVRTWDRFHLIKDNDGHFYNVPLDVVAV